MLLSTGLSCPNLAQQNISARVKRLGTLLTPHSHEWTAEFASSRSRKRLSKPSVYSGPVATRIERALARSELSARDGMYAGDAEVMAGDSADGTGLDRCSSELLFTEGSHVAPLVRTFLWGFRAEGAASLSCVMSVIRRTEEDSRATISPPRCRRCSRDRRFDFSIHCTMGPKEKKGQTATEGTTRGMDRTLKVHGRFRRRHRLQRADGSPSAARRLDASLSDPRSSATRHSWKNRVRPVTIRPCHA